MLSQSFQPLDLSPISSQNVDDNLNCSLKVGVVHSKGIVGSSYFELGDSKIMSCVLCPRTGTRQSSQSATLDCGVFEVDVRYSSHIVAGVYTITEKAAREEKVSSWVQSTLHSAILMQYYPKQFITVSVNVLQSSEYDLSAIVNGVTLALANASIHMRDLTCSHTMILSNKDTKQRVGAQSLCSSYGKCAKFAIATLPALEVTSNTHLEGRWERDTVTAAEVRLSTKCKEIRALMASKLKQHLA